MGRKEEEAGQNQGMLGREIERRKNKKEKKDGGGKRVRKKEIQYMSANRPNTFTQTISLNSSVLYHKTFIYFMELGQKKYLLKISI